jgi:hypothetical protein
MTWTLITQTHQMDPPHKEKYPSVVNLNYSTGAPMTRRSVTIPDHGAHAIW